MKTKVNNPREIINYLKLNNIPFDLRQTMFRKDIVSKLGNFSFISNDSGMKKSDLGFIGLVKRSCEKLNNIPSIDRSFINYINMSGKIINSRWLKKDLYEIDLKGAYWNFAKQAGYLSEDIYLRGLEVDKKVRLIALGNLAKRVAVLSYDGFKYAPVYFEPSAQTQNIFFHVSQLTDQLMKKLLILSRNKFLFYWVDAVIVQGEKSRDEIIEYLEGEGIEFKTIKLNSMFRNGNKIMTYSDYHVDMRLNKDGTIKNEEGKRVFNFKKNDFIYLNRKRNGKKSKKVHL